MSHNNRFHFRVFATVFTVYSMTTVIAEDNLNSNQISDVHPKPLLCDYNELQNELSKALILLAAKQQQATSQQFQNAQNLSRQDDYDEIPYYVPAIGKVIASVLARNVTSIIEESLGFIPPDVYEEISFILKTISQTLHKLNPMQISSGSGKPTGGPKLPNVQDPETLANITKLLNQALAQETGISADKLTDLQSIIDLNNAQLASTIVGEIGKQPGTVEISKEKPINSPTTAPSTNDNNIKIKDQDNHNSLIGSLPAYLPTKDSPVGISIASVPVYAPAYAPNYGLPTTRQPVYAPGFSHADFEHKNPQVASTSKPTESMDASNPKEGGLSSSQVPIFPPTETSTLDYYDYYEDASSTVPPTSASKSSSRSPNGSLGSTTPSTPTNGTATTEDEYYEYYEDY